MKLYTRGGDTGQTALFDGARVPKHHARVAAYGEVDELNAILGWCRCLSLAPRGREGAGFPGLIGERLRPVQEELFILGSELATPRESKAASHIPLLKPEQSGRLELWIDEAVAATPDLRHFILPGGTELAARLHVARTCCRRAERAVTALAEVEKIRPEVIVYLNRLSDLLFAWARQANVEAGLPETLWKPPS